MKNNNFFPLERNRYFQGKMLTARDFETEQKYFNDKRRIINRCLFGAGVVCGLGVYRNDDSSLMIETGLALDYTGREIIMSTPVIRKLQMIDGAEQLANAEQAYLCIEYEEHNNEPVNNLGVADDDSEQYNKIEEGYHLYLDVVQPDLTALYAEGGRNSVTLLFSHPDLCVYQIVPCIARAGESFDIRFVVMKAAGKPPVSFSYSLKSEYIKGADGGDIELCYQEEATNDSDIRVLSYTLRAVAVSDMQVPFGSENAEFSLSMGNISHNDSVPVKDEIYLCGSASSYEQMERIRMSSLEKQMAGGGTPIYLAKIDYASAGSTHILRKVTALPFLQRVSLGSENVAKACGERKADAPVDVSSELEVLKYWQKPEVAVKYDQKVRSMRFHFGLPSSEAYDYATSSGVVDVPLTGSIRVNARFESDEITHNLGLGNVCITLAAEYADEQQHTHILFGNGDVFSGHGAEKAVPRVDLAAVLYPETGTFRIGIWCLDHVEGHVLRVRWFAYKATRDTANLRAKEIISVKILPEISKLKTLGRLQLSATVTGTSDKGVIWSVEDPEGGKIDQNGLYQAPSAPGTYEIVAQSGADDTAKTSAFVIVEE